MSAIGGFGPGDDIQPVQVNAQERVGQTLDLSIVEQKEKVIRDAIELSKSQRMSKATEVFSKKEITEINDAVEKTTKAIGSLADREMKKIAGLRKQIEVLKEKARKKIESIESQIVNSRRKSEERMSKKVETSAAKKLDDQIASFRSEIARINQELSTKTRPLKKEIYSIQEQLQKKIDPEIRKLSIDLDETLAGFSKEAKTRLLLGWTDIHMGDWREGGFPAEASLCLHLECVKEQILNQIVNRKFFYNEARKFIEVHQEEILTQMGVNIQIAKEISFTIERSVGGDSHNGGKSPLKICFSWIESGAKRDLLVYYKPRPALSDHIIVEAWGKLREEGMEHLPQPYKIICFVQEHCSIWENVPGEIGSELTAPSTEAYIEKKLGEKFSNNSNDFQVARAKVEDRLRVLDQVSRYLGLGDLHSENCIFDEGYNPTPIDMEVIKEGIEDTSLLKDHTNSRQLDFTEEQKKILEDAKVELKNCLVRFLPADTNFLNRSLRNYSNFSCTKEDCSPFAKAIIEEIKKCGYHLVREEGEKYITEKALVDFFNYEVSFFSIMKEFMYNGGTGSQESCIAAEYNRPFNGGFVSMV